MGGLTKNDVAGLADFGIVSIYDPVKREPVTNLHLGSNFAQPASARQTTVMKCELGILVFRSWVPALTWIL